MGGPRRIAGAVVTGALALGLAACASSSSNSSAPKFESGAGAGGVGRGWDCPGGQCNWSKPPQAKKSATSGLVVADQATTTTGATAKAGGSGQQSFAPFLATSVDDNEGWNDYVRYLATFTASHRDAPVEDLATANRVELNVRGRSGRPLMGADLAITDSTGRNLATLRTYAGGRALYFPEEPGSFTVTAAYGTAIAKVTVGPGQTSFTIDLDAAPAPSTAGVAVDVQFLLDATGSMGDELDRLKANMTAIAQKIQASGGSPRFGVTLYRDKGDEFRTRTFDLTTDLPAFSSALGEVVASGGGDTPEDLAAGLHDAVTAPSWRPEGTIKLVVLVGDAPPHVDYDLHYGTELRGAQAQGIKVLAIGAQGLDEVGQFVFRQLGQQTLGRYVSLTFGPGGDPGRAPGSSRSGPAGLDGLPLDELVSRLVGEEIQAATH